MNPDAIQNPGYVDEHWDILAHLHHQPAGPVGSAPLPWAERLGFKELPCPDSISRAPLTRTQVLAVCQDPDVPVLGGYICAMAWGGQGVGPTRRHARSAWDARDRIQPILERLRHDALSRGAAYELFRETRIPGLGPSYWTKLLFFFVPGERHYVMDQWVAKSVNLLAGRPVVPLSGGCPAGGNPPSVYDAYCAEIDRIAGALGLPGSAAEELMMSRGGRHPGIWRAHVRARWN